MKVFKKSQIIILTLALILGTGLAFSPGTLAMQTHENLTENFVKDKQSSLDLYKQKIEQLENAALTARTVTSLGKAPAGEQAGHAVFISICDTAQRASVFCGTGSDLCSAWSNADAKVSEFLVNNDYTPVWVKVDIVTESENKEVSRLNYEILAARHEFYRKGVAFDPEFKTALLEAEMNASKAYDYDKGALDFEYLNRYLKAMDREPSSEISEEENYLTFECIGWICDENDEIYRLSTDDLAYGRREKNIDKEYAKELILNASSFLEDQILDDGSFIYGMYPRFDRDIENYNIMRHASTLWSLICRYNLEPSPQLAEKIESTIQYMLDSVIYDPEGRAYLYEEKADEIKLGGCGVAVIALTEYMKVFQNQKYEKVCEDLGNGILSLMNQKTGEYYHVLNGDFSKKEPLRTVYYDGEATFALCRLYGLTGEEKWLDAAKSAVNHFIEADYSQYKDHWVAYSMNEITQYVPENLEYYEFALKNAQNNLEAIRDRDTTYHTYLELLMATFEIYDRMRESGMEIPETFDLQELLNTISVRASRQLNGYFYPEYAMYMKNPQRILDTFMVRHDGYRVRIDDVQHNIGGLYLYYKNYEKMKDYGLKSHENFSEI